MIPQIIVVVLAAFEIALHAIRWGEERTVYDPRWKAVDVAFFFALLYWGGFWSARP